MHRIAAFVVAVVLVLSFHARASAQATRPAAPTPVPKAPPAKVESPQAQADARRALSTRLPETKLTNVPLADAIESLQDLSGANIHVNWRALETIGITRDTPITLRMQSLPLRKLLQYVLAEAEGQGLATFYVEDGVIEVTTRELADQRLITRVYPVEDLLLTIPDFDDAPNFTLQTSQQTSGRGGGGGSGQSLLGGGQLGDAQEQGATREERGQELVQLVMDTVQPDVWRENGGTASIRYFRGRLIVTAPRSVHEQIGGKVLD